MKKYVAGFLFNFNFSKVVLIMKERPDWQKGLLNGVGGHIESGESPHDAMIREFEEEAGVKTDKWNHFCQLTDDKNFSVDFFYTRRISGLSDVKTVTDEKIIVVDVEELSTMPTIPNLQWLIPMAIDDHDNFYQIKQGLK
jgi:8-oxo-dGTP diphosphatase